jgi:hypothetical protein
VTKPTPPVEAKRRYEAHFTSKLTDADGENSETDTWLDFARDCGYLNHKDHQRLNERCGSIGKMLGSMLKNSDPFLLRLCPLPHVFYSIASSETLLKRSDPETAQPSALRPLPSDFCPLPFTSSGSVQLVKDVPYYEPAKKGGLGNVYPTRY